MTKKSSTKTTLGHKYQKGNAFKHKQFPSLILIVHQRVSSGVTVATYKVKIHGDTEDTTWTIEERKLDKFYEEVTIDE